MYCRFLMYALVSPETLLILLLYRLNLSQFCLKFIWTSNYLIKEIVSQTVVVLLFWFSYWFFFWFWCSCNNFCHSEKRRVMKFIKLVDIAYLWIFFLVLLLQFKVILSSDKYKKSLYTLFYKNPRFLRLTCGFGQKDKKHAKKLEL